MNLVLKESHVKAGFVIAAVGFFVWWLKTRRVATVIIEGGEEVPAFYGAGGRCFDTKTDAEVDPAMCIRAGVDIGGV